MGKSAAVAKKKQNGKKKEIPVAKDKKTKRSAAAPKPNKKDPNCPKRPATAFFMFLEDFRETFKKENPHVKGVAAIGKAGGDKWKSMTDKEKEPYITKAAKRKADYEKDMEAYNKKKDNEADEEEEEGDGSAGESEVKSKSAAMDDDEEEEEDDDDDDD